MDRLLNPESPSNQSEIQSENVVKRLDSLQAFMILFAISFGPTFIALNLSVQQQQESTGDLVLVAIILIVFIMNHFSVDLLTKVHQKTQMTSYQEIAYRISKSNRGYVYLISVLKIAYLTVTCAYSLQFCAVYLTSVLLPNTKGGVWAEMLLWCTIFGAIAFYLILRLTSIH